MKTKPKLPRATFEVTQIEVGTGNGYRWATAYYVIKPTGEKLFPPMVRAEAIAYCKAEGWDHSAINS